MEIIIAAIIVGIIFISIYLGDRRLENDKSTQQDVSDNLLSSYKEALFNIMKDVIEDEINMYDMHKEEELLEILLVDIKDKFISLLIQEESDKVLSIIEESTIDEYISDMFVMKYDIREIYYNNKIKYKVKENKYDEELGTERVSNSIKSDSSTIDITDDLNGIFFNDI